MARAKAAIGDVACLQGNVPVGLIHSGTPDEVEDYCRKLIGTAGKGGGYIMTTGAGIDRNGKVENVRAMVSAVKKYGAY
jgi:uroporphyrinogen-III decarboxylase